MHDYNTIVGVIEMRDKNIPLTSIRQRYGIGYSGIVLILTRYKDSGLTLKEFLALDLRPYYFFRHILTELPKYCDEKGNIDSAKLDHLMPWAEELPEECRKPRRS